MQYENYLMTEHQVNVHSAIFKIAEIRNLKIAPSGAMEGLIHDIYDILEELQHEFDWVTLTYNVADEDVLLDYQQGYLLFSESGYTVHYSSEPCTILDDNSNLAVVFDTDFNKIYFIPLFPAVIEEMLTAAARDHAQNAWHDFVLSL